MKVVNLETPISTETVRNLRIGDMVYIDGIVYTARDAAHDKMQTIISDTGKLPFNLDGGVIFHAGPVALKKEDSWDIDVIGPTTSTRLERFAQFVAGMGVKLIIGKGGMGEQSQKTFVDYGMVYLQAAPGCGVKFAQNVEKVNDVYWPELGMAEAVWCLKVQKFGPFVVGMDSTGRSIYQEIADSAQAHVDEWFKISDEISHISGSSC